MNFLLKGFKELNFSELLAVNGGCSGICTGYRVENILVAKKENGPTVATSQIASFSVNCNSSISLLNEKNIISAINNNFDKSKTPYVTGKFDCDIWTEKVLKEAGFDISGVWGKASDLKVEDHEKKLEGLTSNKASVGWNVVLMTDSDKYSVNHCGIVKLESDGTVGFYQNTKSAGGPVYEKYKSINAFQNAYAYKDFDYLKVSK